MYYLNVKVDTVRSPEAASCPDAQIGTWLRTSSFCAEKENGGRILNCANWSPIVWQRLVGIDAGALEADCPLWTWDGDDLVVAMYPVEQEEKFRTLRENASRGGRAKKSSPPPDEDVDEDSDEDEDVDVEGNAKASAKASANDTPTPPPKSSGLAVPVKPTKASPATTYELTDEEVGNLRQLHPSVDVVAVINDYQRKVAAHVKQPYTAAKLLGGLDAWCSHGPDHRKDDDGGNRGGWMQPTPIHEYGFSMDEYEVHHLKAEWSEYISEESDRCGWGAELAPWLTFEEWKRTREAVVS